MSMTNRNNWFNKTWEALRKFLFKENKPGSLIRYPNALLTAAAAVVVIAVIIIVAAAGINGGAKTEDGAGQYPKTLSADEIKSFENMLDSTSSCWLCAEEDFDSETATPAEVINNYLICRFVAEGMYTYFWEIDTEINDSQTEYADPKGLWWEAYKLDAHRSDWIIKNVFGVEPDHETPDEYSYYYEDELYICRELGGGPQYEAEVVESEHLGDGRYGVTVVFNFSEDENESETYVYADVHYFVISRKHDERYGDYWSISRFSQNNKCYSPDKFSKAQLVDSYIEILDRVRRDMYSTMGEDSYMSYALADINRDGVEDLITRVGTCEADFKLTFYVYDSAQNKIRKSGTAAGGHTAIYINTSDKSVYLWYQQMGYVIISRIDLKETSVELTVVSEGDYYDYYVDYPDSTKFAEPYNRLKYVKEYDFDSERFPLFSILGIQPPKNTENEGVVIEETEEEDYNQPEEQPDDYAAYDDVEHDRYNIRGGGYFVIKNTPAGAGVVMRYSPDPQSEKLGIVEEGGIVKALNDYSSLDNGYVWVCVDDIYCWVMADYMYPCNPFVDDGYSYEDLSADMYGRVCFATPDHAGINMRESPNSTSEKIDVLFEGTVIDILGDYNPANNGYIFVGYDHPHAGEYYTGWVMASYIEFYGYV